MAIMIHIVVLDYSLNNRKLVIFPYPSNKIDLINIHKIQFIG